MFKFKWVLILGVMLFPVCICSNFIGKSLVDFPFNSYLSNAAGFITTSYSCFFGHGFNLVF